jgi:hypothetical protein
MVTKLQGQIAIKVVRNDIPIYIKILQLLTRYAIVVGVISCRRCLFDVHYSGNCSPPALRGDFDSAFERSVTFISSRGGGGGGGGGGGVGVVCLCFFL